MNKSVHRSEGHGGIGKDPVPFSKGLIGGDHYGSPLISCGDEFEEHAGLGLVPVPPTPEELMHYAADKRWQKEVGGTLWNGLPVHTDRESQSKIIAERLAIEAGERDDPDYWKFADGVFRQVSNEDFTSLASAVRQHVRDCFALEGQVLALITTGVITTTEQIDLVFEHGIEALYGENEQSEDK